MCSPSAVMHDGVEAGDVDGVAGMHGAARCGADGLDVGCVVVARDVGVLAVHAVIEKLADLDALDEIRHAAHVIGMEVGDEHLVDLRDARIFHRRLDALGVAAIVAGPAGIDQQRAAGGRDQQRGLAAFHIDGVDVRSVLPRARGLGGSRLRQDSATEQRRRWRRVDGRERTMGGRGWEKRRVSFADECKRWGGQRGTREAGRFPLAGMRTGDA